MFSKIPAASSLSKDALLYPYRDCYRRPLQRTNVDAQQLIAAFANAAPPWVNTLMSLRGKLVAHWGLKTGFDAASPPTPPFHSGQLIGVFRIIDLFPTEAVLGQEDRHLDFRISLLVDQQRLSICTLVRPHNVFGVLYLACVLPFHHLISFVMLRRMTRLLERHSAP